MNKNRELPLFVSATMLFGMLLISGCGKPEYEPPKDAIPEIPPGTKEGMTDLSPPGK